MILFGFQIMSSMIIVYISIYITYTYTFIYIYIHICRIICYSRIWIFSVFQIMSSVLNLEFQKKTRTNSRCPPLLPCTFTSHPTSCPCSKDSKILTSVSEEQIWLRAIHKYTHMCDTHAHTHTHAHTRRAHARTRRTGLRQMSQTRGQTEVRMSLYILLWR